MINEEENKEKVWQAPEVYDLDVDKTASGKVQLVEENAFEGTQS